MNKKMIGLLTAVSVFATPITSLAANNTTPQTPVCTVANCQINETHDHNTSGTHNKTGHSNSHGSSNNTSHRTHR